MRIGRFSQMFLLLVVSGWGTVWAAPEKSVDASILQQSAKITTQGTVVDAQGEPLIGVSILEVGTTNGTITDIDGKFTLQVTSGATLELSYIGYKTQQLKAVSDLGTIQMSDDTEVLQEVVVTALGIKREKKALGYAMQEVKENLWLRLVKQILPMLCLERFQVCKLFVLVMDLVDLQKFSCVVQTL